jgi:hypothetical protein
MYNKQVDVFLHNCANAIWSLKGLESPILFCLGYFSSTKNFNYIAKVVSIHHLKLGDNCRPSYFPTFTHMPSPWPTYCKQLVFDMEKYNRPTTSGWFLT